MKARESEEEDISLYGVTLRKQKILDFERGSIKVYSPKNSFWKSLWS
jgi:hypothetical protein